MRGRWVEDGERDDPKPDDYYRDPQCRWKHRRNCKCRGDARKPIKLGSGT